MPLRSSSSYRDLGKNRKEQLSPLLSCSKRPVFLFSSSAVVWHGEQGSTGHNHIHTSVCKDILFRCCFFFPLRFVITEHSVHPTYSEKYYLCCAGIFSTSGVVWLCLLIVIGVETVFAPCSKSSFSPGCDLLCLETQQLYQSVQVIFCVLGFWAFAYYFFFPNSSLQILRIVSGSV